MQQKEREIPHYVLLFFAFRTHFRIFRNKCIAGLTSFSDIVLVLKDIIINALAVLASLAYFSDRYPDKHMH